MNILADCKRVINRQFVPKKGKGSFIHKKDKKMRGFSARNHGKFLTLDYL